MLPLRDYHSHSRVLALDRPIIDCRRTLIANQHWCTPAPLYEASCSSFRTPWTLRKPRCTSLMLRDRGHLSWTKCSKTLARLRDDLTSEDLDARALLSELCQPAAWPFLRESRHGSEDVAPGSLQDWDVQVISLLMDVFLAAFLVQSANIAFCSMLSPGVDDAVMWSGSSTPQVASSALYLWILCRQGLTRRPRPGGCMPSSKDGSRPSKVVLRATLEPRATCAATWRPSGH